MLYNDYYILCKDCDNLYHCFDREVAEQLENNNVEDFYLRPDKCFDFEPLRKQ